MKKLFIAFSERRPKMNHPIRSSHYPKSDECAFVNEWISAGPVADQIASPFHVPSDPSLNDIMDKFFSKTADGAELPAEEESNAYPRQVIYLEDWKYDHSKLSSQVQDILNCLALFTSVINLKGLKRYIRHLQEQPELAGLPFHLYEEVIQGAVNRGLLTPDPQNSLLLNVQPTFPYYLKTSLYMLERKDKRRAVETAFQQYYGRLAGAMYQLIASNKEDENALGELLIRPEYDNFVNALELALDSHASVINVYRLLSRYLKRRQDHGLKLELGNKVLAALKEYPPEKLDKKLKGEFVAILGDMAKSQLSLGRYSDAEHSYLATLEIWLQDTHNASDLMKQKSVAVYHSLGKVAQNQGEWDQAKTYYLKGLKISGTQGDPQLMTPVLHSLFHLWRTSKDTELPAEVTAMLRETDPAGEKGCCRD